MALIKELIESCSTSLGILEKSSQGIARLQPVLPFAPPSASEAEREAVVAAVPAKDRRYVDGWLDFIAKNLNGTWRLYAGTIYGDRMIRNGDDFIRAEAHLRGVSVSSSYAKLRLAREILRDPQIPKHRRWFKITEALVPKPRPGRSGHSFFTHPQNIWMWPELRNLYLNQARLSTKAAHELLCELITKKQRAWGLGHHYPRPTLVQCRTALAKISKPEWTLARQGEKAYYDQCSRPLRRKPPKFSNLIWCTDQKVGDVIVQDGGHRLGRITLVNFIDVTSWRWLGFSYAPVLSSDVVMRAAADALVRAGTRPAYVQHDQGGEFKAHRFAGRFYKIDKKKVYAEASGLWARLGIKPVPAIGNNPRTKPIERWHAELRKFDQQFPTWTGNNKDERPELVDKLTAQHYAWLRNEAENPRIPTIEEYVEAFQGWCATTWNLKTRSYGRYLQGMTPQEAWIAKRPPEGFPPLSEEEINIQTCDRRKEQVSNGGGIRLQIYGCRLEYFADELREHQGEQVEVLVSRISYRCVTAIYNVPGGTASCVAQIADEFDWVPEDENAQETMRAAIRAEARMKRKVRDGIAASGTLAGTANPLDLLRVIESLPARDALASRTFGAPGPGPQSPQSPARSRTEGPGRAARPPLGHPEISSTEFVGERLGLRHARTTEEIAKNFLALEADYAKR